MARQSKMPKLIIDDGCSMTVPLVSIVPTIPAHIGELKSNLRPEDAEEILRLGMTINHALWRSYRSSLICKTALIDDKVAAIWGVHGTFMGNIGTPWLMTSGEVSKVSPLKFARIYQDEIIKMLKMFQRLENYVDSDYSAAIRLLEIIGFTVDKGNKLSPAGNAYRRFWMEK